MLLGTKVGKRGTQPAAVLTEVVKLWKLIQRSCFT